MLLRARLAYTSRGSCACATEAMMALAGLLIDYSCFVTLGFGREGFEGMQEGFELAARHRLLLSHLRANSLQMKCIQITECCRVYCAMHTPRMQSCVNVMWQRGCLSIGSHLF
jgi:hypothetical protein